MVADRFRKLVMNCWPLADVKYCRGLGATARKPFMMLGTSAAELNEDSSDGSAALDPITCVPE
jgi:hypothetical protein